MKTENKLWSSDKTIFFHREYLKEYSISSTISELKDTIDLMYAYEKKGFDIVVKNTRARLEKVPFKSIFINPETLFQLVNGKSSPRAQEGNPFLEHKSTFDFRKGEDWIKFKQSVKKFMFHPFVVKYGDDYKVNIDVFGRELKEPLEQWEAIEGIHRYYALYQLCIDGEIDKDTFKVPIYYIPLGTKMPFEEELLLPLCIIHFPEDEKKQFKSSPEYKYVSDREVYYRANTMKDINYWWVNNYIVPFFILMYEYQKKTGKEYEVADWLRYENGAK